MAKYNDKKLVGIILQDPQKRNHIFKIIVKEVNEEKKYGCDIKATQYCSLVKDTKDQQPADGFRLI